MTSRECPSYSVSVWIAGDLEEARRSLRRQCFEEGLCVTVTPTQFVYTAGMEDGVCVRAVNYPRFPKQKTEIWDRMVKVARTLMDDLYQNSAFVEGPDRGEWSTRRPEDLKEKRGE